MFLFTKKRDIKKKILKSYMVIDRIDSDESAFVFIDEVKANNCAEEMSIKTGKKYFVKELIFVLDKDDIRKIK